MIQLRVVAIALGAFFALAPGAARSQPSQLVPVKFTIGSDVVPAAIDPATIEVLFNPKEYIVQRVPPGHEVLRGNPPNLEFTSGEPYRVSFELFFDRYEEGKSVREFTDKSRSSRSSARVPRPRVCSPGAT